MRAGVTVQLAERDRRLFGDTATVTAVGRCDFASCPHGNDCVTLRTVAGSINRNRRNVLALPLPQQGEADVLCTHVPPDIEAVE